MSFLIDACNSCQRPIVWGRWRKSGKYAPFDPEPVENGVAKLTEGTPPIADYVPRQVRGAHAWFVPHFVTCPDAAHHRRR